MFDMVVGGSQNLAGKFLNKVVRKDVAAYSDLNTRADDYTFLCDGGALRTVFEFKGTTALIGSTDAFNQQKEIFAGLKDSFTRCKHSLQIVFCCDPDEVKNDLDRAFASSKRQSVEAGLDVVDLIDSQIDHLSKMLHSERMYWVITTYVGSLGSDVLNRINEGHKIDLQEKAEKEKETGKRSFSANVSGIVDAQNTRLGLTELLRLHRSLMSVITNELPRQGLFYEMLTIQKAASVMRSCFHPSLTQPEGGDDNAIRILGDLDLSKEYRKAKSFFGDASEYLPPPIAYQITPSKLELQQSKEYTAQKLVRYGDLYYGVQTMHLGPSQPKDFIFLLREIKDIPWRINFQIDTGGLSSLGMRRMMLSVFGFLKENQPMQAAIKYVESSKDAGDPDVCLRISTTTWAKDPKTVALQQLSMMRAFTGWGGVQMTDFVGDEAQVFLSTIPGFSALRSGVAHAVPFSDVLNIIPLQRPCMPWKNAMMMLRTGDCKPMPYNTGTSEQKSHDELVFASMGSGKSMFLNSMLLHLSMSSSYHGELPLILVADVGWSSYGTIMLLKERLPQEKKHLVQYYQLTNSDKDVINPFDLTPGMRRPASMQKDMLVYLLQIIITPQGQTETDRNADTLARMLIDVSYERSSNGATAKSYVKNTELKVDEALISLGFDFSLKKRFSWYEVGDFLFFRGDKHSCSLAYRHAVPVLSDIILAINDSRVQDLYGREDSMAFVNQGSESLISSAQRSISSAMSDYKVLSGPTQLDIGDTRILAVNLDQVARGEPRRAAIMYLLVRDLMARKAYITDESVAIAEPEFKPWMQDVCDNLKKILKVFSYDEFHRTSGIKPLRDLIKLDLREGRKWKIKTILVSQLVDDFDDEMIELAANLWVLGTNDATEAQNLVNRFGLPESAFRSLVDVVTGPRPEGAPMLGLFKVKEGGKGGKYVQVVYNTLCPTIIWALTTDPDETSLRTEVFKRVGSKFGLEILSKRYPRGAKLAIEEVKTRGSTSHNGIGDYTAAMASEICRGSEGISRG